MELRHLLAVDAVLATGSFTAAAAARHLSQPALWAQIKELESELGLALFQRSGRGVAPTAACLALRPRLALALEDVAELRRVALEIREGSQAPARVGCSSSHVARFLAGCIAALMAEDPKAPFPVIVPVTTGSAVQSLAGGRLDLLVEPRDKPAGLDAAPLYAMRVIAFGPAAGCGLRTLDVRALHAQPLATLPRDSLVRAMLERAAERARVTLRVVYESRDAAALLALARAGVCTAVLHDEMVAREDAKAAVAVTAAGRALETPLWLAWRPDEALSPAARALRDVMRARARARGRAAKLPSSRPR